MDCDGELKLEKKVEVEMYVIEALCILCVSTYEFR